MLQDYRAPTCAIYPTTRHLSVKVFIDISLNASDRKSRSVEGRQVDSLSAKHDSMTLPDNKQNPATAGRRPPPWIAFRHTAFAVIWMATVVANVRHLDVQRGVRLAHDEPGCRSAQCRHGSGHEQPSHVLVRAARRGTADTVNKRRFLIGSQIVPTVFAATSAILVWLELINPTILLVFTFLLGAGVAFTAPAWQSVVPRLVPKQDLSAAIASNAIAQVVTDGLRAQSESFGDRFRQFDRTRHLSLPSLAKADRIPSSAAPARPDGARPVLLTVAGRDFNSRILEHEAAARRRRPAGSRAPRLGDQ